MKKVNNPNMYFFPVGGVTEISRIYKVNCFSCMFLKLALKAIAEELADAFETMHLRLGLEPTQLGLEPELKPTVFQLRSHPGLRT